MIMTWSSTATGAYWPCLRISTRRSPRVSLACVALSRSEPNWAKACQLAVLGEVEPQRPAIFFMAGICAAPPTRETEMPAFTAGRTPELKRSASRKIWPSVIEMTLVGM